MDGSIERRGESSRHARDVPGNVVRERNDGTVGSDERSGRWNGAKRIMDNGGARAAAGRN